MGWASLLCVLELYRTNQIAVLLVIRLSALGATKTFFTAVSSASIVTVGHAVHVRSSHRLLQRRREAADR